MPARPRNRRREERAARVEALIDDTLERAAREGLIDAPLPETNGAAAEPEAPRIDGASLDGAALLDEVHDVLTGFVVWPSESASVAYTSWIAATHAQRAWEHATRFVFKSPIKRCGKTRAQEVGRELVHKPLPTANISPAALSRSIEEDDPPTIIIDEADTIFGKGKNTREGAEDLRGILNAGHSRGWPYIRWDPQSRRRDECPTFAMAMLAGIGDLPDTIEDRATVTSMRRRAPDESVRPFRRRVVPGLHELRDRLHAWVTAHAEELEHAEPDLPVEDRDADVWEPLVAIADLAGGDWPERARDACRELCSVTGTDESTAGERLLADLKTLWKTRWRNKKFVPTPEILGELHELEEAPWADWYGKPLTAESLARLFRPYRIKSRSLRRGEKRYRGYARRDLTDAWHRYVPDPDPETRSRRLPETPATPASDPRTSPSTRGNARRGSVAGRARRPATGSDLRKRARRAGVAGGAQRRLERADDDEGLPALEPDDEERPERPLRPRRTARIRRRQS